MDCHHCQKENKLSGTLGRRETCQHCGADLHVCLNCQFYDPKAYNECSEPQADRVLEKDRANFCDYFQPGILKNSTPQKPASNPLDALFKK